MENGEGTTCAVTKGTMCVVTKGATCGSVRLVLDVGFCKVSSVLVYGVNFSDLVSLAFFPGGAKMPAP